MSPMSKLLLAAAVAVALQQATSAQGFFGGPNVEVKVVERFDADKNGRLDTAERQEARKSLGATGVSGGFQRRRGGLSPAGPSTRPPGLRVTPADVKPLDQATLYDPSAL